MTTYHHCDVFRRAEKGETLLGTSKCMNKGQTKVTQANVLRCDMESATVTLQIVSNQPELAWQWGEYK